MTIYGRFADRKQAKMNLLQRKGEIMNNQDTNQTVKQTETVVPVANNQNTPVATTSTVSDTVKLELTADQAEMVQDLLSDFVYAYRSDREVDCKRELVRRDQVGKYPYIAEAPDPSIINPIYDWVGKKWYSKSGSTSLPEIAQAVKTLQSDQQAGTTQNLALTKAVKELSEGQANQNKLLASMQNLMLTIAGSQKTTAPKQATTATQPENN